MRLKPRRTQQPLQGASEARVVLDNGDGRFACGHVWVHDPHYRKSAGHSVLYLWANFGAWRLPYTFSFAPCRPRGCGLEDLAEPLDRTPQLGRRLHSHFVHYLAAMRFDRALADTEHVRDLLIDQAAHDERKELALARRQAFVARAPIPLLPLHSTRCGTPG